MYLAEYTKALRTGELIRPDKCELCGKHCKPHGHHKDYNKALDVMWLCSLCHRKEHKKNTPKQQGYHREYDIRIKAAKRWWTRFDKWWKQQGYHSRAEAVKFLINTRGNGND